METKIVEIADGIYRSLGASIKGAEDLERLRGKTFEVQMEAAAKY